MRTENQEQAFRPIYHYALVTDAVEGLILVDVDTLADGEPRNNFLRRALTWNPKGLLTGARHAALAGDHAYVAADAGLVVVNLADPLQPRAEAVVQLRDVRAVQVQFRYAFVTTADGLQVLDVTRPGRPQIVKGARVPLRDARKLHVARTYAYVAAGADGLAIVDVTNPAQPRLYRKFDAGGRIKDARDVVVGSTNASLFAYVADAAYGLHVLQLTAPDTQPKFYGFSPAPAPQWIAGRASGAALSLSRGLERDRAVDESGGQVAVFGRLGSRPFTLPEMQQLYLDKAGRPWVADDR
jgi:hypothetical protein